MQKMKNEKKTENRIRFHFCRFFGGGGYATASVCFCVCLSQKPTHCFRLELSDCRPDEKPIETTPISVWQSLAAVSSADQASPAGFWVHYNTVMLTYLLTLQVSD